MRPISIVVSLAGLSVAPTAWAWGAAGHEIVATIAQMYLHPDVLPTICYALDPNEPLCHLAPVSTWADRLRFKMRWSAPLHYVGSEEDHPSQTCVFPGPSGWAGTKGGNVLGAIRNATGLLEDWTEDKASDDVASEALKFLIHFVGDMHQPLHTTGRDRGGNSAKVRFGGRQMNLHSLWDGYLIAKAVRLVPRNYSRPLPYPRVEKALRGTIYDSYIRRILWEGAFNKWAGEIPSWLSCPDPKEQPAQGVWQTVLSTLGLRRDVASETDDATVCPYHWATPIHDLNCEIVWPKELDEPPYGHATRLEDDHHSCHDHDLSPEEELAAFKDGGVEDAVDGAQKYLELDTPEYSGVIAKQMMVEKLLMQGGIRLAGILNYLFAESDAVRAQARLTLAEL